MKIKSKIDTYGIRCQSEFVHLSFLLRKVTDLPERSISGFYKIYIPHKLIDQIQVLVWKTFLLDNILYLHETRHRLLLKAALQSQNKLFRAEHLAYYMSVRFQISF